MVEPTLTKRESARGTQYVLDSPIASLASSSVSSRASDFVGSLLLNDDVGGAEYSCQCPQTLFVDMDCLR